MVCRETEVMIAKEFPPPRRAQNKSGCEFKLAVMMVPEERTHFGC